MGLTLGCTAWLLHYKKQGAMGSSPGKEWLVHILGRSADSSLTLDRRIDDSVPELQPLKVPAPRKASGL